MSLKIKVKTVEELRRESKELWVQNPKQAVCRFFSTHSSLVTLDLWQSAINDDLCVAIAGALTRNTTLEHLLLRRNHIFLNGAKALATMLKTNTHLKTLDIRRNHVGLEGIRKITRALNTNHTLQRLNLARNNVSYPFSHTKIDFSVAHSLAEALKVNQGLRFLDLSENDIRDSGICIIAQALKYNYILTDLSLCFNHIREEGAEVLASIIAENTTLRMLNLSYNFIGERGALAFAKALRTADGIQEIHFYWSDIGYRGLEALFETVQVTPHILKMGIAYCGLGEMGKVGKRLNQTFKRKLQKNRAHFRERCRLACVQGFVDMERRLGNHIEYYLLLSIIYPMVNDFNYV
jgi:Ran GTPase-activating protein (RanGAP) involved in mRNA processing and transport